MLPTERLIDLYRSATPKQLAAGHQWYRDARAFALALSANSPYSLELTAGVIAVLSPRMRYERNVQMAAMAVTNHRQGVPVKDRPPGVFGAAWAKAYRVLDGDLSAISGDKVRSFWLNIIGSQEDVTVDSWAARAAMGWPRNDRYRSRGPGEEFVGHYVEKHYQSIKRAYIDAAAECGVTPRDLQAVVWIVVREDRLHGTQLAIAA